MKISVTFEGIGAIKLRFKCSQNTPVEKDTKKIMGTFGGIVWILARVHCTHATAEKAGVEDIVHGTWGLPRGERKVTGSDRSHALQRTLLPCNSKHQVTQQHNDKMFIEKKYVVELIQQGYENI